MSLRDKLISLFPQQPEKSNQILDAALAASCFPAGSTRLEHMRCASNMAARIAKQCSLSAENQKKLITAALYHDVGYSNKLKRTGFHPLDGAIFLAYQKTDEEIIEAVLWHSSTIHDITFMPEIKAIYDKLPPRPENSFLLKAVSFCDFRSSPIGEAFSFGQRINELKSRFGAKSRQSEIANLMLAASQETLSEYVTDIQNKYGCKLPWIFCDIDNTLIQPGTVLNEESHKAIHNYMDAGGRFSLVTGKHLISIENLIKQSGLPGPHSGINGSVIYENGEIKPLGPALDSVEEIENILIARGIHYTTYCHDSIWTRCDLTLDEQDRYTEVGEILPQKGPTPENKPVFKILTYAHQSNREICHFVRELAEKQGLGCVRTSQHFLELMPKGHGKHSAAAEIMHRAGWPDLFSISIGDSENDVTMFGLTGYSAAVENAEPKVIAAADMLIPRCDENGVAKLIEAILTACANGEWRLPTQYFLKK